MGRVRADAAVNAGNTLCSLAELLAEAVPGSSSSRGGASAGSSNTTQDPVAAGQACQAFEQARQMYQTALEAAAAAGAAGEGDEAEDADTWSNLADCLVAHAQLLAEGPLLERRAEAQGACQASLEVGRAHAGSIGQHARPFAGQGRVPLVCSAQPEGTMKTWKCLR